MSRARKSCSSAVALPKSSRSSALRLAALPLPLAAFSAAKAASTSRRLSAGAAAALPAHDLRVA
jgi:hypothetical protein